MSGSPQFHGLNSVSVLQPTSPFRQLPLICHETIPVAVSLVLHPELLLLTLILQTHGTARQRSHASSSQTTSSLHGSASG